MASDGLGHLPIRFAKAETFAEIAGGCFCCRFNTLMEAAGELTAATAPEVFIAEPVGSCTDLVATVTYPLRRLYGNEFTIAPLSELIDPVRARRVFGLEGGGGFSSKVTYIFKKQLEEADVIVISKSDLITPEQECQLRDVLARNFPKARLLTTSTRQRTGLDDWFQRLLDVEHPHSQLMTLDYDVDADGEALLGWLNATLQLTSDTKFDANAFLADFATDLQTRLRAATAEIAHLKMTFSPDDAFAGEIASIHCVRNDTPPESGMELDEPATRGQLIVNLRAEAAPDGLLAALQNAVQTVAPSFPGLCITLEHKEHFRPGRPEPTYRDGVEVSGTASAYCTPEARARSAATGAPCC